MKFTPLFLPALLLFGGAGPAAASVPVASVPVAYNVADDAFDSLVAEYVAANAEWKAAYKVASKAERRELRKTKPGPIFWKRFQELSAQNNGQAKLWLISNVRANKIKSRDKGAVITPLYLSLASDYSDAEWFDQVLEQLAKDHRAVGQETTLGLYETVISKTKSSENLAGALFGAGTLLKGLEDEASQKRGEEYYARVEAEYAETSWGKKISALRASENVQVGKFAPDFTGKTIDGFEFNLSDYKGKVVMLDFYGFW